MRAKTHESKLQTGVTQVKDAFGVNHYLTSRPFQTAPKIIGQYKDADGVRMYKCEDDRHFIADIYDKMFVPVGKVVNVRKLKTTRGKKTRKQRK